MVYKAIFRRALASSVAAGALIGGAAQQAYAAEAAPAAAPATALAEVVVTAQRRGENLQDVPIAVNAITADQLRAMGSTSSEDLNQVPGVVYNSSLAGGGISIRGISGTNGGTDEPANAIYMDGVYQYAATAGLFQFNGIDRIEVLKGPQGTLFGRNTAGGVIQIITRDPGREPAGEAQVGYANYSTTSGNVYLNAPLSDTLAANIAAFGYNQADGWGRNLLNGHEEHKGYNWGVHGKLKWVAKSGDTDVTLSGLYNKDLPIASGSGTMPVGLLNVFGQPSPGIFNTNSDLDAYREVKHYGFSATIHQDLGFARLTSISAYDDVKAFVLTDADASPLSIPAILLSENYKDFTQEFQLQSKEGSRLQWIVGVFYLRGESDGAFTFPDGPHRADIWTYSYAAFGQATYAITDDTKLTAGLRFTSDRRRMVRYAGPVDTYLAQHRKDDKPSWRLALDHKFSEDVLGYVSYSRGFKSGVFNATTPDKPAAGPTQLDAYEVGVKSEAFEHRLRVNAAVYYYDYQDIQAEFFSTNLTGAYFLSAGAARSYGLDLDVAAEPVRNLTLTGGISLLNAKFTSSLPLAPCFVIPSPAVPGPLSGPPFFNPSAGLIPSSCPLKGNQLPFSPKFTGTLAANYKYETGLGTFDLAGSYSHNSGFHTHPSNFEPARATAFDMVNASVTWTSLTSNLNASLWGKNLLDVSRVGGSLINAPFGGQVFPMAPRTYGVTLGVKF